MKRILTAENMRACDSAAIAAGTPSRVLMERAGEAVARVAKKHFDTSRVLAVCGGGNNGGDGIIAAIRLYEAGCSCTVKLVGTDRVTRETGLRIEEAKRCGIEFCSETDNGCYTLIIDALLGIGANRAPTGELLEAIQFINSCDAPVLSVDIPSGVCADTGALFGEAVYAHATVTMVACKRGLLLGDGAEYSGRIYAADIGIATDTPDEREIYVLENSELSLLPKRARCSNKGTFGRVLIIGGSKGMCGAAYLSAKAALRSGAGLVEIFAPEANRAILQTLLPEAIVTSYAGDLRSEVQLLAGSLERATAVVLGPGLSVSCDAEFLVKYTYRHCNSPIIIDADALNITARASLEYPTDVPVIITPHPGEMSRLTGESIDTLAADPWSAAEQYAAENDIICVLKFAKTVIADGTSRSLFVNSSGCSALAKGGSGDVLSGTIAGMLCQGLSPVGAASLGVFVHGRAGEFAAEKMGEYSPLAGEVCDCIAKVLKGIESR